MSYSMRVFIFQILFFIFCCKWCWEVFRRFGSDVYRLREAGTFTERFAILLVWFLTLPLTAYILYFVYGLLFLFFRISQIGAS